MRPVKPAILSLVAAGHVRAKDTPEGIKVGRKVVMAATEETPERERWIVATVQPDWTWKGETLGEGTGLYALGAYLGLTLEELSAAV